MRTFIFAIVVVGCRNEVKTPTIVDDTAEVVLMDSDGDGFYEDEDCDDSDSSIYPNAPEICDGVDNNCNQEVDEDVTITVYVDADGDGFGDPVQNCKPVQHQTDWCQMPMTVMIQMIPFSHLLLNVATT